MGLMLQDLREDCTALYYGDGHPVMAGPALRATGWRGGTWVQYVDPGLLVDEFVVERSDGNATCGFLLFPPEAYNPGEEWGAVNNFTGMQLRTDGGAPSGSSTVTLFFGGGRYMFRVFETVPIDAFGVRSGGALTYNLHDPLKISENGLLCNDPDARLALVGIANPVSVCSCSAVPAARNNFALGVDMHF